MISDSEPLLNYPFNDHKSEIKGMKIISNLFRNKNKNPFHDWIKIMLVIYYRLTAIQM